MINIKFPSVRINSKQFCWFHLCFSENWVWMFWHNKYEILRFADLSKILTALMQNANRKLIGVHYEWILYGVTENSAIFVYLGFIIQCLFFFEKLSPTIIVANHKNSNSRLKIIINTNEIFLEYVHSKH